MEDHTVMYHWGGLDHCTPTTRRSMRLTGMATSMLDCWTALSFKCERETNTPFFAHTWRLRRRWRWLTSWWIRVQADLHNGSVQVPCVSLGVSRICRRAHSWLLQGQEGQHKDTCWTLHTRYRAHRGRFALAEGTGAGAGRSGQNGGILGQEEGMRMVDHWMVDHKPGRVGGLAWLT